MDPPFGRWQQGRGAGNNNNGKEEEDEMMMYGEEEEEENPFDGLLTLNGMIEDEDSDKLDDKLNPYNSEKEGEDKK